MMQNYTENFSRFEHKFDKDVRFGHLNWAINKNYVKSINY